MRRAAFLLLAALPLAGCKLVDQRSFDRTADTPPHPHLPAGPGAVATGPVALVSFPADAPRDEWADVLRTAAGLARSRKPDVLFRVVAVAAPAADPQATAARLAAATVAARAAADVLVDDGVDRAQVELAAATDPAARRPTVRIFVR